MALKADITRCESTYGIRSVHCRARAAWLVGVGSRTIDRQYACERHLNRACWAMLEGEGPYRSIKLTVTAVPPVPLELLRG